jgi:hypothetical protein
MKNRNSSKVRLQTKFAKLNLAIFAPETEPIREVLCIGLGLFCRYSKIERITSGASEVRF